MAKLEAVLDADISPFQRKLAEATEKARQFGEGTADVGKDLFKSLTGFDIGKALGIGGAIYAATKLGDALVDAAKEGLAAFSAYQDAVLKFKYTIPVGIGGGAAAGGVAAEAVESATAKAGLFSAESMRSAALYLLEGSKEFRESPEKLNDMLDSIKALALKTGGSPEAIAESYRRLVVGIKEEGSQAVGKFFKSTPGLEAETEKMRDAHAEAYLHAQGLTDASQANTAQAAEYHRLQREPISEFMVEESKRKGATGVLEEIKDILERSAPKAIITEAEEAHPEKMLAKAWEEVSVSFGKELKPAIDDFVKMLITAMPAIGTDLQSFGALLNITIKGVIPILNLFGNAIQLLLGPLAAFKAQLDDFTGHVMERAEAESRGVDERIEQLKKAKEESAAGTEKETEAAKEKAAIEAETRKEAVKSAEEVAKIEAKSDAAHEASQRRISYEATQSDLRSAAIAAAHKAVIDRPRGATEELDKEYAAQADAAAKIINIKAGAAEKINAAEEEAANRIATINEEQASRDIDRKTAEAMDEGAEKSATLARLNAEDDAAQVSRNDAMAEAREKEREADMDAANAIIDAQEAAAERIIDAQESAALALLDKMKGPFEKEEAPARWETFSRFGKRGEVIEGSADRKAREERNAAVEEANRQWKELQRMAIEKEFADKKRVIEDALERQRPTLIGLKRTHELQQEEHVKAIEAEKGRTEADKEFAAAHAGLKLPTGPDKLPTGKADISRQVLANLLIKILEVEVAQLKDFDGVFLSD